MFDGSSIETILAHAGSEPDPETGAIIPPLHLSTTFERDADGSYSRGFMYSRNENPTRLQLERTLAMLENGTSCYAFASGMAASTAVLQALEPGAHVVLASDLYYGMRRLVRSVFSNWGIAHDEVDVTNDSALRAAIQPGKTRLVWIESPSNPLLNLVDISAVADATHAAGAVLVVDNSWATPVLQQPIRLGADVVVHSVTKYLSGHSDVLGGAVIFRADEALRDRVRHIHIAAGSVMDPFSAWLTLRGLRTLSARLKVQCRSARQIAAFLNNHPAVEQTFFPGLAGHSGHEIAARQMADFGGMLSFLVKGDAHNALEIAAKTRVFRRATSLGGTESLIEHRASLEGKSGQVPENLLRLSIGLEHPDDLVADLSSALSGVLNQ